MMIWQSSCGGRKEGKDRKEAAYFGKVSKENFSAAVAFQLHPERRERAMGRAGSNTE